MTEQDANGISNQRFTRTLEIYKEEFYREGLQSRGIHSVSPLLQREQQRSNSKVNIYYPAMAILGHASATIYAENIRTEFRQTEELKYLSLQFYCEGNHMQKMLYDMINSESKQIRDSYIGGRFHPDYFGELALIMLLNSCFILNFMEVITGKRRNNRPKSLSMAASDPNMNGDIMMLENQIPYFVLKMVINTVYGNETEGKELLRNFFSWMLHVDILEADITRILEDENPPLCILEACWRLITTDHRPFLRRDNIVASNSHIMISIDHLHFDSATELKSKGIHFRPSSSCFLNDITFESHLLYGTLKLPTCYVSLQTQVMLANMIAHEVSLNDGSEMTVLSYVHLMKSLIQTPDDVRVLQAAGLLHRIGYPSHEQVVEFFKSIPIIGMGNSQVYRDVIVKVREHSAKRANNWAAEVIHDYFLSPWKIIGLLAATVLIVLTFLQTIYTMKS